MFKKISPFLIIVSVFAVLIYRLFILVPVTINGANFTVYRGISIDQALKNSEKRPPNGKLLDVNGKLLKKNGGLAPTIYINGKKVGLNTPVSKDDNISAFKGRDKTEPIVSKIEKFGQTPTGSSGDYLGQGALIMYEKAHPGQKEIKFGKISKKIVSKRVISDPAPDAVVRKDFRAKKVVALTFDDGPSEFTQDVLDVLKENKVKATFFVLGGNISQHPGMLKKIKEAGSTVENHTYTHIYLSQSSKEKRDSEISKTDYLIEKETGRKPRWIRPPGGALNYDSALDISRQGYKIAMWNIDTNDWKRPSSSTIVSTILSEIKDSNDSYRPGQVILMHDGGGDRTNSLAALPDIIRELKDAGYGFVTLDELIKN